MKRSLLSTLLLVGAIAAPPALADAVDDVRRGQGLYFREAQVRVRGEVYGAGEYLMPKPAGTLDVNVPLASLGLDHPAILRLHGARGAGGTIVWTFDQVLAPEFVSGQAHLQRISGQLIAQTRLIPGASTPTCSGAGCAWNVMLTPVAGSEIRISGCFQHLWCEGFTETVELLHFRALAGLPRPRLTDFRLELPLSSCAAEERVHGAGVVTVATPAPTGGAVVDLYSTDPAFVRVLPTRVPAGEHSARVSVRIEPGWSGTANVVAASGGEVRTLRLDRPPCLVLQFPKLLQKLAIVNRPFGLLADGRVLERALEGDRLLDPKTMKSESLGALLGLDSVRVTAHTESGELAGLAKTKEGEVGFLHRLGLDRPQLFPKVRPLAVTPLGLGVGEDLSDQARRLVFLGRFGTFGEKVLDGVTLDAAAGSSAGAFAGAVHLDKRQLPATVNLQGTKVLAELDGRLVDVIATGEAAGHARNEQGVTLPFRWSAQKGLQWLALPEKCTAGAPVALNESGWIAGHASCGQELQVPFLTRPDGQSWRLDALVPPPDGRWAEVVALSDTNSLLARAVTKSGDAWFLIHP